MNVCDPFVAPGGTLFIPREGDLLLTTLDGGEAAISWIDLFAFLRHLEETGRLDGVGLNLDLDRSPNPVREGTKTGGDAPTAESSSPNRTGAD